MKNFFFSIIIFFVASVGVFLAIHTQKKSASIASHLIPSITSSPSPTPALPDRISIPAIGVNAAVESVGLDSQKRMDVPRTPEDVAWYNLGARPGERGSAVIDGHLDTPTGAPAVFWNLNKLTPSDTITIHDSKGGKYTFVVTSVVSYPYDQVPLQKIFADNSVTGLNLITCSGTWDKGQKNYSQRTVVYSVLKK